MLTKIANPTYDSVFKYLMEDNCSAKVVLSRLLQKPVLELTMKRNEYTKATKEDISVYRIDFAATILNKDVDGSEKKELVTIELQKHGCQARWQDSASTCQTSIRLRRTAISYLKSRCANSPCTSSPSICSGTPCPN